MKTSGMWAGLMLAACVAASGFAVAQDGAKPEKHFSESQLAQQQRMKDCSADAKQKQLKGDDRKALMKTCLSGGQVEVMAGDGAASVPDEKREKRHARREKRKACKAEAKTQALNGDARRQFMSECLSK